MGAKSVLSGRNRNGGVGRPRVRDAEIASGSRRGDGIPGHDAVADGERGDLEIYAGSPPTEISITRDSLDQRSDSSGVDGAPIESDATSVIDEVAKSGV